MQILNLPSCTMTVWEGTAAHLPPKRCIREVIRQILVHSQSRRKLTMFSTGGLQRVGSPQDSSRSCWLHACKQN